MHHIDRANAVRNLMTCLSARLQPLAALSAAPQGSAGAQRPRNGTRVFAGCRRFVLRPQAPHATREGSSEVRGWWRQRRASSPPSTLSVQQHHGICWIVRNHFLLVCFGSVLFVGCFLFVCFFVIFLIRSSN